MLFIVSATSDIGLGVPRELAAVALGRSSWRSGIAGKVHGAPCEVCHSHQACDGADEECRMECPADGHLHWSPKGLGYHHQQQEGGIFVPVAVSARSFLVLLAPGFRVFHGLLLASAFCLRIIAHLRPAAGTGVLSGFKPRARGGAG